MKKQILLIVTLFLAMISVDAQHQQMQDTLPAPASFDVSDTTEFSSFTSKPNLLPYNPDKKISVRMEMGTSFGVGSGGGGLFGIYAAPHISYKVTPKFRINFGAMIRNSNFINYYNPYGFESLSRFENNITQTFVYIEGEYLVNDRLLVHARGYKEIARFNQPDINSKALGLDNGGVALGFDYKVTDNFHFGAEVSFNKGNAPYNPYSPYLNNGFVPGGFNNPFSNRYRSPFDPW
jgi:hypothetical protein